MRHSFNMQNEPTHYHLNRFLHRLLIQSHEDETIQRLDNALIQVHMSAKPPKLEVKIDDRGYNMTVVGIIQDPEIEIKSRIFQQQLYDYVSSNCYVLLGWQSLKNALKGDGDEA